MDRRSIKYLIILFAAVSVSMLYSCKETGKEEAKEEKTSEKASSPEQEEGWISLFDGKTLHGWKQYGQKEITKMWGTEDGMIVCNGEGGGEADGRQRGSLITTEQFDNFELIVDWKISPEGNSGILYHIVEKPEYKHAYDTGPEYQLLDDVNFPSPVKDVQKTAAAYDMYPAKADKKLNPAGEWNTAKIVYDHGHVEHWLNGEKVLEYDVGSADWKARYEKSKWVNYPGWNQYKKGSIGLQDHGSKVWFKNIRIKKL